MSFALVLLLMEFVWLWIWNYPLEPGGLISGYTTDDNDSFFQESVNSQ